MDFFCWDGVVLLHTVSPSWTLYPSQSMPFSLSLYLSLSLSLRCLFGEMKVRDAILKGTTEAEQLELIYKLFGTPTGTLDPRSQPPPHYCFYKEFFYKFCGYITITATSDLLYFLPLMSVIVLISQFILTSLNSLLIYSLSLSPPHTHTLSPSYYFRGA